MNTLRTLLDDYLVTRRALGYKLHSEGTGLKTFVSFMDSKKAEFVTTELALEWAMQHNQTPEQAILELKWLGCQSSGSCVQDHTSVGIRCMCMPVLGSNYAALVRPGIGLGETA